MKQLKIKSVFLILFLMSGILLSQVPQTISYQGVLTDATGTNVTDGNYSIIFTLYDALTGGTNLWTETQTVTVSGGLFNVILGSVNPINLEFDKQYWLGISIEGGDELTPRTELTSSAYSLNTKNIPDNIVTAEKVANGNLVRSINSLKDNVTLAAGSNVNISESGNTITISASGGGSGGISSLDGVSNDGGNIDLVAGSNITITPDDANNKITIAASGGSSGDNLGNHTATQNIKLNGHWLSGDGGNEGVYIKSDGKVGIGSNNPLVSFDVNGTTRATTIRAGNPVSSYGRGDIAAVNNIIADDNITAGDNITANGVIKTGTPSSSYETGDIVASHDLKADLHVYSKGNIHSNGAILTGTPSTTYGNGDIVATDDLKCDDDIYAGDDIEAGGDINANGYMSVGADININYNANVGYNLEVSGRAAVGGSTTRYYQFKVYGDAYATGSWNSSDIKFKKNIKDIGNTTEKLKKLRGVSFDWKVDEYKEKEFSDKKQFGFIAQEVEKVFPNLVKTDENGEKAVNYIEVIPLLLEAYKYQQKEIEELRSLINH